MKPTVLVPTLLLVACGWGGSSPAGPTTPLLTTRR